MAALLVAAPAALGARLAASAVPSGSYKLVGAHSMLTVNGYHSRLKHADYLGVGSIPVGNKMIYGGGRVLTAPQVYLIFWDWTSDPAGEEPYLKAFFGGLGTSDWLRSQDQYCQHVTALAATCAGGDPISIPRTQLAGVWDDHADVIPPNPLTEPVVGNAPQVADEVLRAVAHFGYNPNAVYFVATPHGIATSGFAANGGGYCAWHAALELANGDHVAFTNFPYVPDAGSGCGQNYVNSGSAGTLDSASMAGGHEYAEAITDPDATFDSVALRNNVYTGWYDPSPIGGETGDKCAYPLLNQTGVTGLPGEADNITLNGRPFAVQPLWSNDANNGAGGCVIYDTPPAASAPGTPSAPSAPAYNPSAPACPGAQIVDPAGDAVDPYTSENTLYADQASLDILNVRFSTPNPSTLEIKTTIDNLAPFPQGDTLGGLWSVYFDVGGTTYVASVASDASGTMYMDGVHTMSPQAQIVSAVILTTVAYSSGANDVYTSTSDTGSFNPGPDGSVVIDVPLSHIGSPRAGSILARPWAVSYGTLGNALAAGAPGIPAAGNHWQLFPSDEAPDSNPLEAGNPLNAGPYTGWPYALGSSTACSTVRPLPAPPADNLKPPKPAAAPPIADNCSPEWTNAPGNEELPPTGVLKELTGNDVAVSGVTTGQDPQLDLLAEYIAVSPDVTKLRLKLVIENLSLTVPPGAQDNAYYIYFSVNGQQYFAEAQVDLMGAITYAYGVYGTTGPKQQGTPTGSFTLGPDGIVEIDVPLSAIGNPKLGTLVEHNGARAVVVEGAIIVDVSDGAEASFPNFTGLSYRMSTASCTRAASVAHSSSGGSSAGAASYSGSASTGGGGSAPAAGHTAAPSTAAGSSPSSSGAPSQPAPKQATAKVAVKAVPAAAVLGVAAAVVVVLLGVGGFVAYRRGLLPI